MSKAPLDISKLNNLFQYYSKNKLIRSERNIYAKANEVYDITDSNGQRYYLRILKTQLPETIEVEAQIQEKLTDAGIRTPRYLRLNNNSYVGNHEGTLFTLSKYIKGETPTSAPISLIKDFAVVAAKIHRSLEGTLLPPSKSQWFDPRNARRDLNIYKGPLKNDLQTLIDVEKELFKLKLPKSVIHADLWIGNIFADGGKITTIFDFETAEYTFRIFDLARIFLHMRLETEFTPTEIMEVLFEGYDIATNKPLIYEEKTNFELIVAYIAGACAAWNAVQGSSHAGRYINLGKAHLK